MSARVSFVALAVVALYFALDVARVLPVSLRDDPWPFEAVAATLCAVAAVVARSRAAAAAVVVAAVATLGLAWRARSAGDLPPPDLPVGGRVPSVVVRDLDGAAVDLSTMRGGVLFLFRGASCPYCRAQLAAAAPDAARFAAAGVGAWGVGADGPLALRAMRDELALDLALLADEDERAAARLCGGRTHCVVVVDDDGVIRWAGASESWSDAPAPARLLQHALRLRR